MFSKKLCCFRIPKIGSLLSWDENELKINISLIVIIMGRFSFLHTEDMKNEISHFNEIGTYVLSADHLDQLITVARKL